ncbi:Membrane protein YcjF [Salmonella enterica subsp. arizonae]|uniref:Membrane protein YcjF n=1 Tax=Salmonella enterica subsp. arizonae TaxID=59203 RepID=A0A379SKI3_SALER|nr:Membrane protein YcjF [Salmonella enterica subsp. arizonae]
MAIASNGRMSGDEARELLHSHSVGKGRAYCEKLAQQRGIDQSHPALQRWYAAIHETQTTEKSLVCMRNWCSRCSTPRHGVRLAVLLRNRL